MISINCASCGHQNDFQQPHRFHAGFGNQGFLYNEAGNLTLVWSSFDPAYEAIVGRQHPWALTTEQQARLESMLHEAPTGGRWLFRNPARCLKCTDPISESITHMIYYLRYPDSVDTDSYPGENRLKEFLLRP